MAEKKEKCPNCQKEIDKDAKFCKECGEEIKKGKEDKTEAKENNIKSEKEDEGIVVEEIKKEEQNNSSKQGVIQKSPPISIVGFICSLCGIITCGISAIVGLILSIIGFEKSKNKGYKDGLALAGIIISIILILLFAAVFANINGDGSEPINGGNSHPQENTNNNKDKEESDESSNGGTNQSTKEDNIKETEEAIKEEFINSCEEISYKDIARQPDSFKGRNAHFRGKIIQVSEGYFDSVTLRVEVTEDEYGFWDDAVYVTYTYKDGESKLLDDDIINMYGVIKGTKTYTTIFGASVTIPYLDAEYIFIE